MGINRYIVHLKTSTTLFIIDNENFIKKYSDVAGKCSAAVCACKAMGYGSLYYYYYEKYEKNQRNEKGKKTGFHIST